MSEGLNLPKSAVKSMSRITAGYVKRLNDKSRVSDKKNSSRCLASDILSPSCDAEFEPSQPAGTQASQASIVPIDLSPPDSASKSQKDKSKSNLPPHQGDTIGKSSEARTVIERSMRSNSPKESSHSKVPEQVEQNCPPQDQELSEPAEESDKDRPTIDKGDSGKDSGKGCETDANYPGSSLEDNDSDSMAPLEINDDQVPEAPTRSGTDKSLPAEGNRPAAPDADFDDPFDVDSMISSVSTSKAAEATRNRHSSGLKSRNPSPIPEDQEMECEITIEEVESPQASEASTSRNDVPGCAYLRSPTLIAIDKQRFLRVISSIQRSLNDLKCLLSVKSPCSRNSTCSGPNARMDMVFDKSEAPSAINPTDESSSSDTETGEMYEIRECAIPECPYLQPKTSGDNFAKHYRSYHPEMEADFYLTERYALANITKAQFVERSYVWKEFARKSKIIRNRRAKKLSASSASSAKKRTLSGSSSSSMFSTPKKSGQNTEKEAPETSNKKARRDRDSNPIRRKDA